MPGYWLTFASLALQLVGRSGALASLDEPHGSRFLEAALQIDSGRFEDAAETLRAVGAPQLEAEVRILAARERRISGDDAGASALLARARELLIELVATARLRDLDAETGVSSRSGGR